jgi:hypothetical protein
MSKVKKSLTYHEGQDNPKDQARVIISGLKGWCYNLNAGRSRPEKAGEAMLTALERLEELIGRYPDLEWDVSKTESDDIWKDWGGIT